MIPTGLISNSIELARPCDEEETYSCFATRLLDEAKHSFIIRFISKNPFDFLKKNYFISSFILLVRRISFYVSFWYELFYC